jgi:hypothetical protein
MRKKLAIFLTIALALGGLPLFVSSTPAFASWDWCWDDPIVQIGNHQVRIDVGVPADQQDHVSGGTVTVHVPRNVHADVVSDVPNPLGLDTVIKHDASDGQSSVDVLVNADKSLKVEVQISVDGSALAVINGKTNSTINAGIDN